MLNLKGFELISLSLSYFFPLIIIITGLQNMILKVEQLIHIDIYGNGTRHAYILIYYTENIRQGIYIKLPTEMNKKFSHGQAGEKSY